MTADKAREITEKCYEKSFKGNMEKINNHIKTEAEKGISYTMVNYIYMNPLIKKELESKGFKVKKQTVTQNFRVSWD